MPEDPLDRWFSEIIKKLFKDMEAFEREFMSLEESRRKGTFPEIPMGFKVVRRGPGFEEQRSGFSIFITSDGRSPPKVDIRRFGPGGWEPVKPEEVKISGEKTPLAVPAGVDVERVPPKHRGVPVKPLVKKLPKAGKRIIPEHKISVGLDAVTIEIDAPEVESKDQVDIKFFKDSVEIRAVSRARNVEYFCPATVPPSIDPQGTTVDVTKDKVIVKIPRKYAP